MPWATLGDVPPNIRTHNGARLTLAQANAWGKVFDDLIKAGIEEAHAAAIAWTFFERLYRRVGDEWVKRSQRLSAKPQNPPGVEGRGRLRGRPLIGQRHEDPTMTRNLRDTFAQRLRGVVKRTLDRVVKAVRQLERLEGSVSGSFTAEELFVRIDLILQTGFEGPDVLDIIEEQVRVTIDRARRTADRRLVDAAGADAEGLGNIGVVFDASISDAAIANLALAQMGFMTRLETDLANRIIPALRKGIELGESIPELARRVREVTNFGFSRATTIARTETIRTFNEAAKQRFASQGVNLIEWITAGDERVDLEICDPLEGQRFLIDAAPPNPAHPRCRCSWLPVLIGGPSG